jgi:aldose 1-epimerase
MRGRVTRTRFGTLPSGEPVHQFTLTNGHGLELRAIDYGGIVVSLATPDRDGVPGDIVLGFDSLAGYLGGSSYVGAIVGRYANRIANGRFTLDGATYQLQPNNGPNALHGGPGGFDRRLWRAEPQVDPTGAGVVFRYPSPDGEEGYPGTVDVEVTYTLTERDEWIIDYRATTDRPTPINLTQHSYFNLAGEASGDVRRQVVTIDADHYLPVDQTLIPNRGFEPVAGTPFDFRQGVAIGARIEERNEQLEHGRGYDHAFVLNRRAPGLAPAARAEDPASGRTLEVETTEPGLQLYTGNFLEGPLPGKGGRVYRPRDGFCLETEHFPDSPNQPAFPSTILRPGQTFRSRTVYRFGVVGTGASPETAG